MVSPASRIYARTKITDAYGRPFNNLRIAVTAECNYKCIFCHIEGEPIGGPARIGTLPPRMTPEDYGVLAEAAWLLGADSFKITGGEPLVRRDIVEIVRNISQSAPGSDISMTTNGYLLEKYAPRLAEAGLRRVNISIHSLNRDVYEFITGVDGLDAALAGLRAAREAGLKVKINMVVLRGVNEDEIWSLARLAAEYNAILQLIELHPVGQGARFFRKYYYPLSIVEDELRARGATVHRRSLHNRPIYQLGPVRIEVVRPYANPIFCAGCTRIRVGPFGDLSPCLNWRGRRPNVLAAIRGKKTREEKVLAAARTLLEANMLRRPFFLAGVHDNGDWHAASSNVKGRMRLPKRVDYQRVLGELERLLLGRAYR